MGLGFESESPWSLLPLSHVGYFLSIHDINIYQMKRVTTNHALELVLPQRYSTTKMHWDFWAPKKSSSR